MIEKRLGWGLSVAVWLAIGLATLTPSDNTTPLDFWCIACGDMGGLDVAANIVMFIPLGFALVLATGRRRTAVLLCMATTLFVETMQIRIVSGRDASLSDLLANSVGGVIGAELALRRMLLLRPSSRAAGRLALGWSAICLAVLWATSAGLTAAALPEQLWIQWLPPRASFDPFTGRLLSFDINGLELPLGYPDPKLGLSRRLRSGAWRATAVVSTAGLVPRRSVIVRVADEYGAVQSLEQSRRNFTCWQKTRSADFRFRAPRVALVNGFADPAPAANDTAALHCERRGGQLIASVSRGSSTRSYALRLSPSLGWLLLSPFDIEFDARHLVISALWLAALFFPAGYWARVGRYAAANGRIGPAGAGAAGSRGTLPAIAIGGALVGGLWLAPVFWHLSPAAAWEWLSTLAGIAIGGLTAQIAGRWRVSR